MIQSRFNTVVFIIIIFAMFGHVRSRADIHVVGTMADKKATHFVLVHGFSSGGWCWFKIKTRLEEAGYKVSCPDLKSAGIDNTNVDSITTLEEYDEPLTRLLSSLSETEKVVLVGTSAGGVSLTHMMHKFPHKIHMVMFVGATMLRNGFLTEQDIEDGIPSDYSKPKTVLKPTEESPVDRSMQLCTPEDKTLAKMLTKPGPFDAIVNATFQDYEGVDSVRRIYIKTKQDLHLTPMQQEAMITKWPPNAVFTVDSDHCPYLSKPSELLLLLVQATAADL